MTRKIGWFPEYTPGEQLVFNELKKIIKDSYERFGYVHIETPAVERKEILFKWGESASNEIFGLYGMATGPEDIKPYGLNFDLTIPFARYVLDHQGSLTFPFKRYQQQFCFRGERPQRGRFRQFMQCDIDAIWRYSENNSYLYYDAEMLYTLRSTVEIIRKKYFPEQNWMLRVNNRKLLSGFFQSLTQDNKDQTKALYKLFDDYYKIGHDTFLQGLQKAWLTADQIQQVEDFVATPIHELDSNNYDNNELFAQWVQEIQQVFSYFGKLNADNAISVYYDPFIVRGLAYYTGTVFETLVENDIGLGSLCSGGRYANLTQSIDQKSQRFDGVGGSIGLSRLFTLIQEDETMKTQMITQQTQTEYLLINFEDTQDNIFALAHQLASEWKTVEIYPEPVKLWKQFGYADKKGIPFVILLGAGEKEQGIYVIKEMKTRNCNNIPL